jgi:hypothetical protein
MAVLEQLNCIAMAVGIRRVMPSYNCRKKKSRLWVISFWKIIIRPSIIAKNLLLILTKVKELDIQTFVTGHGHTVGKSQIEVMLAYLSHLNEKVQVTIEKGEFFEQLLSTDTPNDYSNWTGIDGYKRSLTSVFNKRKELNLN